MIVGIDPGASGALAWLSPAGELLAIEDMPGVDVVVGGTKRRRVSPAMLAALLRDLAPTRAIIENVGPTPKDGAAGAFAFGKAAGYIEGVLSGLSIPYDLVTPQAWKKAAKLTADKGACRMRAAQLYPGFAGMFSRVKDDGRAEAVLIARHGVLGVAR